MLRRTTWNWTAATGPVQTSWLCGSKKARMQDGRSPSTGSAAPAEKPGAFCQQSAELLDNDQFEAAAVVSLYAWSHVPWLVIGDSEACSATHDCGVLVKGCKKPVCRLGQKQATTSSTVAKVVETFKF